MRLLLPTAIYLAYEEKPEAVDKIIADMMGDADIEVTIEHSGNAEDIGWAFKQHEEDEVWTIFNSITMSGSFIEGWLELNDMLKEKYEL